jgi:hypothetical protein
MLPTPGALKEDLSLLQLLLTLAQQFGLPLLLSVVLVANLILSQQTFERQVIPMLTRIDAELTQEIVLQQQQIDLIKRLENIP